MVSMVSQVVSMRSSFTPLTQTIQSSWKSCCTGAPHRIVTRSHVSHDSLEVRIGIDLRIVRLDLLVGGEGC